MVLRETTRERGSKIFLNLISTVIQFREFLTREVWLDLMAFWWSSDIRKV